MAPNEVAICQTIIALWQAEKFARQFDPSVAARIGDIRDVCYTVFDRHFNLASRPAEDFEI